MRLIIIRHGDPNYAIDGLTEQGVREAQLLAEYLSGSRSGACPESGPGSAVPYQFDDIYQSPLGRAAKTAAFSLEKLGRDAVTLDWLEEFPVLFDPNLSAETAAAFATELITDPETGLYRKRIIWDVLPSYYMNHPELFDKDAWRSSDLAACSDMIEKYDRVTASFDRLLAGYGYEKDPEKGIYRVRESNDKTIAFFCHYGITSVILSRLWNISPFIPLQFFAMAPTSVTEVVTEEREKGIAIFRALKIGDVSHLSAAGEKPSFSARFCERFENLDERH